MNNVKADDLYFMDNLTGAMKKLGIVSMDCATTIDNLCASWPNHLTSENEILSFEVNIVSKYPYYLLIDRKDLIPNNWLKMHGYPMNHGTNQQKFRKEYRRLKRRKKRGKSIW